jgi:hypothetical protein
VGALPPFAILVEKLFFQYLEEINISNTRRNQKIIGYSTCERGHTFNIQGRT